MRLFTFVLITILTVPLFAENQTTKRAVNIGGRIIVVDMPSETPMVPDAFAARERTLQARQEDEEQETPKLLKEIAAAIDAATNNGQYDTVVTVNGFSEHAITNAIEVLKDLQYKVSRSTSGLHNAHRSLLIGWSK